MKGKDQISSNEEGEKKNEKKSRIHAGQATREVNGKVQYAKGGDKR